MMRANEGTTSKSARKREHLLLQALGEKLIDLPVSDLAAMELDERLLEAVVHAKSITSRGALRRQRQLIGKLMRTADAERIATSLDSLGGAKRAADAVFHSAEQWRERLCSQGSEGLAAFARLTGRDTAVLAGLLRELRAAAGEAARRAVRRRLFREIHKELQAKENGETA